MIRPLTPLACVAGLFVATAASHAATVIQLDFNDAVGNQSLVNRGTAAATASFSGNAGFATDAGAPPNGPQSDAGTFDGSSGGADFSQNFSQFHNLNNLTITAWVNLDNTTFGSTRRIVDGADIANSPSTIRDGFELLQVSDGRLQFRRNGDLETSTSAVSAGTWTFVAAVFSSGQDVDFFITTTAGNVGTADSVSFSVSEALAATTDNLVIGRTNSAFFGNDERVFPGDIDNVRIYDTALTASELNAVSSFDDAVIPVPPSIAMGLVLLLGVIGRRPRRS